MTCKICNSENVRPYFKVRNSPALQNVLYDTADAAKGVEVFDTEFLVCEDCFFLFNPNFKEEPYSGTYNNDQSYSAVYREHLVHTTDILKSHVEQDGNILEIGCGNGMVLEMLHQDGYEQLEGYDPAHAKNLPYISTDYWAPSSKTYDLVVLRQALEGMPNILEVLEAACSQLSDEGTLYLEITNSRYILENASTVGLYHEYAQYFSDVALSHVLNRLGFYIHETHHYFHGDITGVVAKKMRLRIPGQPKLEILSEYDNVCIWGVSGRTIHFLTNYGLDENIIKFGVDIDPNKQGRYIPHTGHKVMSPNDCVNSAPDAVIVLNENYACEVAKMFPYPVKILTEKDFYDT